MSGGWSTIESDEGVFTSLVESLGVKDVQFEEIISLDVGSLEALSPIYGLIFLFRYPTGASAADFKPKDPSKPLDGEFDHDASENAFFAAQTIQNACGTQAVLSVILNQDGEGDGRIDVGEKLREFKDFTTGFPSDLRGESLSNSDLIRTVHNSFARSSPFVDETQRQATESDDLYHFIAYTPVNGVLYELDGLQPCPISHGPCPSVADFPEKVVPVLQRRIARYPEGEIRFNLMAVVKDLRIKAEEIGDQEALDRERRKRREWEWENSLRRWNFVGFIGEVLRGVVKGKVKEGGYDAWIAEAKGRTAKRMEERKKRGVGEEELVE